MREVSTIYNWAARRQLNNQCDLRACNALDRHWFEKLVTLIVVPLLVSCATSHREPPPTLTPTAELPPVIRGAGTEALPAMVAAEREAARTGDLALLARLWAPDGRIIDGRGTLETGDDLVWLGRDAILDRYVVAVFPSPPPPFVRPPLFLPTIDGSRATAELDGDHWSFVYRDGRWWLAELAYAVD